ncbi:TPA: hypothetical protein ACTPQ1_004685 [Salmonella enterica]
MKTINLLTLANGSIERAEDDGAILIAPNGFKVTLSPLQFTGLQVWLREINKRKLPRRMAVGDVLFTLDNVDGVKQELYDVQYKAAIDSLRIKEGEAIKFITVDYNGKRYLQMEDTPFALHVTDTAVEIVIALGMVATPAVLDVTADPLQDFGTLFEAMLGGIKLGNVTTVIRRIPILNAQPNVMTLAESMVAHPEPTAEEVAAKETEAKEAHAAAQREAMTPYRGFLDAIFECAEVLMKPVVMEPAEEPAA